MKYYYGQGKVYLAKRNQKGEPVNMRWVGDVSDLSFELSTDDLKHQESFSGQRATVIKLNIGRDGSLDMKFHEHSPENLALLLYSEVIKTAAGQKTQIIERDLSAGERITLEHINVSKVSIEGLIDGVDYTVDARYGAITFKDKQIAPLEIEYSYAESRSTPMFTKEPEEMYFRFEGINLAENGEPLVVEFYKVQFSPAQAISLINSDTSLNGLQTKAGVLYDSVREEHEALGRYGRILMGADHE